jgi:hypothetical protein
VDGAPRWKGTAFVDEEVAAGCAMIWLAVMVLPLTVPSTRTLAPFLMALADVEPVPLRYVVEDALLTVTF